MEYIYNTLDEVEEAVLGFPTYEDALEHFKSAKVHSQAAEAFYASYGMNGMLTIEQAFNALWDNVQLGKSCA